MPPRRVDVFDDEDDTAYIDELVSDDDEQLEAAPMTATAAVNREALRQPLFTTMNVKQLHDMIHMGVVDLDPNYQREVVWPEAKMIGLIQSLFLNYYVPPILFAVVSRHRSLGPGEEAEDVEMRVCVDGKQRCTSILYFIDGKIPFIAPNKERYWYSSYGSKRHGKQLPEGLRRKFELLTMQVVEYRDLSDIQQRDTFQRVQMGVALSAPEKLAAIPGRWSEWIGELQMKYVTEQGTLGEKLEKDKWDTSRGRPFQSLTAFVMMAYDTTRNSAPTANTMRVFLERLDPPDAHFKKKIEMSLSILVHIVQDYYPEAFNTVKKRLAPVEFWFSALIVYQKMGTMSVYKLAEHIGSMRTEIRRHHVDIRANTKVMKDIHQILSKFPKGRIQGDTEPAAEEYEGDNVDEREVRAAKRSRQAEEEDPTWRDRATLVARDAERTDPTTGTRANKAVKTTMAPQVKQERFDPPRAHPPPPPAVRPATSSMDHARAYPQPCHVPNPYQTQQPQAYQQPQQAPQYQQHQYQPQQQFAQAQVSVVPQARYNQQVQNR